MPTSIKEISGGLWRVFKEKNPEYHYILGVDTASGKEGANESSCCVLGIEDGEQYATCSGLIDPQRMTAEVEKAGRYYKDKEGLEAILAIEKEFHGASLLANLRDTYRNLYYHEDTLTGFGQGIREFGWDARRFRQTAIDWLQRDIGYSNSVNKKDKEQGLFVHDPDTINQLGYFVRNKKTGKYEAAAGKYDDRVSSLYIANFVRCQRRHLYLKSSEPPKPEGKTYNEMLFDDLEQDERRVRLDEDSDFSMRER